MAGIRFWRVVLHIPKFGDASKSPTGDAACPAGDVTLLFLTALNSAVVKFYENMVYI